MATAQTAWKRTLLAAAKTHRKNINGTILVAGEVGSGKSTLLGNLQRVGNQSLSDASERDDNFLDTGGLSLYDYACIPMRIPKDYDLPFNIQTCGCLVLQDPIHSNFALPSLKRRWAEYGLMTFMCIVTINLGDMLGAYEKAEQWFKFLADTLPTAMEEANALPRPPEQRSLLSDLATLRERNSDTLADEANSDDGMINFGFPVLLCGCKSHLLPSARSDASPEKIHEEAIFICQLRYLCYQYGADLQFVPNLEDGSSIGSLHRLYDWVRVKSCNRNVELDAAMTPLKSLFIPRHANKKADLEQWMRELGVDSLDTPIQTLIPRDFSDARTDMPALLEVPVPPSLSDFLVEAASANPAVVADVAGDDTQRFALRRVSEGVDGGRQSPRKMTDEQLGMAARRNSRPERAEAVQRRAPSKPEPSLKSEVEVPHQPPAPSAQRVSLGSAEVEAPASKPHRPPRSGTSGEKDSLRSRGTAAVGERERDERHKEREERHKEREKEKGERAGGEGRRRTSAIKDFILSDLKTSSSKKKPQ